MGTSAGIRSFGGSKRIGGFARRQQQKQNTRELLEMKKRFSSNGGSNNSSQRGSIKSGSKSRTEIKRPPPQYIENDYQV